MTSDPEEPRPDDVMRAFLGSYKLVTSRLEGFFSQAGAPTLIESVALTLLHRAPERRLSLQALTYALPPMTKSGVTRLIDRMERAGLVERQPSGTDKRVTYAALTEKGMATLRYAARVFRDAYALTFSQGLSPKELRELVGLLDRLSAANRSGADKERWLEGFGVS